MTVFRPLIHAPETAAKCLNSTPDSGTSFFCVDALLTSLTVFGSRRQSTTLEVVHRHKKLPPESGVEFMAPISGACVRSQKSNDFSR